MMRIVRSADYRRMPWKNGGGETREIVVSPAGASLEALDWRVSLATVAEHGPFSLFKGVQRTLCVLRGAGIQLHVGDDPPALLYPTSEPYTFDGEATTSARLIAGPIEDLNVMSRRGRFRHTVKRLAFGDALDLETTAQSLIIYCQRGDLLCDSGGESGHLQADDSALFDEPTSSIRVVTAQTAEIILVEFYVADADPPTTLAQRLSV
jgi:environmental stress-induced protein Ves